MCRKMGWTLLGFLLLAWAPGARPGTASAAGTAGATGSTTHPCSTKMDIPELPAWLPEGHGGGDEMQRGNSIEVVVWWEGGSPGERKRITVDLFPSHIPGMCLNSGEATLEDSTFEADVNPDWDLGPDLEYSGTQSITATTKYDLAAGEEVTIVVHSYDWRGFFSISARAEGCDPVSKRAPLDSDEDTLPDPYELQTFLWSANGVRIPYNPGSQYSDPGSSVRDDLSDADLDVLAGSLPGSSPGSSPGAGSALPPATSAHTARGDGLTAWEEYSAVRIGDVVKRTISWQDDGPVGGPGGPDVKESFIHDEEATDIFKLFTPANPFLKDFGVVFHILQEKNITPDGGNAGFVKKHPRGPKAQRVIRLRRTDNKEKEAKLGDAQGFQVGPELLLVNVFKIQQKANDYGLESRDLADWVVAHEIGHKFSLEHNKRVLDPAPALPAGPDRTVWWLEGKQGRTGSYWIPVFKSKSGLQELDLFEALQPAAGIKRDGIQGKSVDPGLTIHALNHPAAVYSVSGAQALAPAAKIKVESHEGNLMDPVPDPGEVPARKLQQLTDNQRAKVNVASP